MNNLDIKARFEEKIIPEPNTNCWFLDVVHYPTGYPQFYWGVINGKEKTMKANRASWLLFKGEIPNGLFVCHKCDVRECVNPDHLYLGTHQDNMNDRNNRGRTNRGSNRYNFKRDEKLINTIISLRETGFKVQEICNKLNIGRTTYYRMADLISAQINHAAKIRNYQISARLREAS